MYYVCADTSFVCAHYQIEHAGVSANERDNDGATPTHFAAARGTLNDVIASLAYWGEQGRENPSPPHPHNTPDVLSY